MLTRHQIAVTMLNSIVSVKVSGMRRDRNTLGTTTSAALHTTTSEHVVTKSGKKLQRVNIKVAKLSTCHKIFHRLKLVPAFMK